MLARTHTHIQKSAHPYTHLERERERERERREREREREREWVRKSRTDCLRDVVFLTICSPVSFSLVPGWFYCGFLVFAQNHVFRISKYFCYLKRTGQRHYCADRWREHMLATTRVRQTVECEINIRNAIVHTKWRIYTAWSGMSVPAF